MLRTGSPLFISFLFLLQLISLALIMAWIQPPIPHKPSKHWETVTKSQQMKVNRNYVYEEVKKEQRPPTQASDVYGNNRINTFLIFCWVLQSSRTKPFYKETVMKPEFWCKLKHLSWKWRMQPCCRMLLTVCMNNANCVSWKNNFLWDLQTRNIASIYV